MIERREFRSVFQEDPTDHSLTTLAPINVNGVSMPRGFLITINQIVGGINMHGWRYYDVAVEDRNGTLYIQGFFNDISRP